MLRFQPRISYVRITWGESTFLAPPQASPQTPKKYRALPLASPKTSSSFAVPWSTIRAVEDGVREEVKSQGLNLSRDAGQGCHSLQMAPSTFPQTGNDVQRLSSHSTFSLSMSLLGVYLPTSAYFGSQPCPMYVLVPSSISPGSRGEVIEITHGKGSST